MGVDSKSRVDYSALKFNQASVILVLLLGFIFDLQILVPFLGALMVIAAIVRKPASLPLYHLLVRFKFLQATLVPDHNEPHRFAQGLGGIVLLFSSSAFAAGFLVAGWFLSWVVIALAALNLFGGFCVGCAVYYWLNRFGLRGFTKSPPPGAKPGRRPMATPGGPDA